MRSIPEDLTTRARIRDAAVSLFGRDGFHATSIRAIAGSANVSAGLVLHHFGSKDGLRVACDEYVVQELLGSKGEFARADPSSAIQDWLADVEVYRPLINYVARMLASNDTSSDALFDALLQGTSAMVDEQVAAGVMREPVDRSITALYLTLYGVVPLVMQRQLARGLGIEQLSADGIRRSSLPILDLYTNGLYTDDRLLSAAREALRRHSGPHSDKGENDPNQDPDPPRGDRS